MVQRDLQTPYFPAYNIHFPPKTSFEIGVRLIGEKYSKSSFHYYQAKAVVHRQQSSEQDWTPRCCYLLIYDKETSSFLYPAFWKQGVYFIPGHVIGKEIQYIKGDAFN